MASKKGQWVWQGAGEPAGQPPADKNDTADDDGDVEVALFRGPGAKRLLDSLFPAKAAPADQDDQDDDDDGEDDDQGERDKTPFRQSRYFGGI